MSDGGQSRKRPAPGLDDEAPSSEEKRQRTTADSSACTEEPHRCRGQPRGKTKWFAVWGGPNPGVHFADWSTVSQWAQSVGAVKQKAFGDPDSAWNFYTEQKKKYPAMGEKSLQLRQATRSPAEASRQVVQPTESSILRDQGSQHAPSDLAFGVRNELGKPENISTPLPSHSANAFATAPISPNKRRSVFGAFHNNLQLCEEQASLVDLIVGGGGNVFYTGSAGVGKSTVLTAFRRELAAKGLKVNVIAPTGRAALDINGQTTWSYAGWVPSSMAKPLEQLRSDAWAHQIRKRLRRTDVLVIDEISMVDNHHFQRLNEIMKEVRQDERPFGGVQLVVTGDFCQLPPVKPFQYCIECGTKLIQIRDQARYKAEESDQCKHVYLDEDKWAFRSEAWKVNYLFTTQTNATLTIL